MAAAMDGAWSLTLVVHRSCLQGKIQLEKAQPSLWFAKEQSFAKVTCKQHMSISSRTFKTQRCQSLGNKHISGLPVSNNTQDLLSDAQNLNFIQRLVQAWRILFPAKCRSTTNAEIAKQRLKMILFADRCSVSDEAKRKIVTNVVDALSHFVEIESEDKVQLNVSTDPDLGTVYAVSVPVRRVKPEYQEFGKEPTIQDYMENLGEENSVNIRFE